MIPRQPDIYKIANEALNYNEAKKIKASERKKQEAKRAAVGNVSHDNGTLDPFAGGFVKAIESSENLETAVNTFKSDTAISDQIKVMLITNAKAKKQDVQIDEEKLTKFIQDKISEDGSKLILEFINKYDNATIDNIRSMFVAWGIDPNKNTLLEKIKNAQNEISDIQAKEELKKFETKLTELDPAAAEGKAEGDKIKDMSELFKTFLTAKGADQILSTVQNTLKIAAPKVDKAITEVQGEFGVTDLLKEKELPEGEGTVVNSLANTAKSAVNRIAGGSNSSKAAFALDAVHAFFALYPLLATIIGSGNSSTPKTLEKTGTANPDSKTTQGIGGKIIESIDWSQYLYNDKVAIYEAQSKIVNFGKFGTSVVSKLKFQLGKKYPTYASIVANAQNYKMIVTKLMADNKASSGKMMQEFERLGLIDVEDLGTLSTAIANGIDLNVVTANIKAVATKMNDEAGLKAVIKNIFASNGVKKSLGAKIGGAVGAVAGKVQNAVTNPPSAPQGQ